MNKPLSANDESNLQSQYQESLPKIDDISMSRRSSSKFQKQFKPRTNRSFIRNTQDPLTKGTDQQEEQNKTYINLSLKDQLIFDTSNIEKTKFETNAYESIFDSPMALNEQSAKRTPTNNVERYSFPDQPQKKDKEGFQFAMELIPESKVKTESQKVDKAGKKTSFNKASVSPQKSQGDLKQDRKKGDYKKDLQINTKLFNSVISN